MKKIIFLLLMVFPAGLCFSQETIELEPIIITAYRVGVSGYLNPSSTDVITAEEAGKKGIFTLTEAIKDLPSISYATTGGIGGITGVNIRGAEAHHTQVMLDGIKLYDPIVTNRYFYGYNYLSLDNLEKIEVLKGPYSSLYGSDSIGGTISLLTRKGKGRPTFSFTQEVGSYQTYREKISAQGRIDKLSYSLSASRADINSFYSSTYKNGNHEDDPFSNFNSCLRLDYDISDDLSVGLLTNYAYAEYEYDGDDGWPTYFPADDDDNYADFHQGVGSINLNHKIGDSFSHKTTFGYTNTYRNDWQSEDTHGWFKSKTYQLSWQGNYDLCLRDKVVLGFDYLRESGESRWDSIWGLSLSPKELSNSKGYYIENIFTPLDNLFLSASFRLEDHSRYEHHTTFSVSGSYLIRKTGTKIKASFGEGFKAPSLYELFDGNWGNPNLKPEESESYEAGFEQSLASCCKLGITYFHTRIKNIIDWLPAGYDNFGKSRIYGIESFFKYSLTPQTSFKLSYTHMDSKKLSDGSRLLRRPDNKLTASFSADLEKIRLDLDISYAGNRMDTAGAKLKSYVLANISLNYRINPRVEAFLRLENLMDRDYELVNGYQTPGFSGYIGSRLEF